MVRERAEQPGLTGSTVLETARLRLRQLEAADAPFIVRLLNEPSFLQFIGDRGVRTVADAASYIAKAAVSNRSHGHGLLLVETRADRQPAGICGLMLKPWLMLPDLAYAFVPEAAGQGFATEAGTCMLEYGARELGMGEVAAVVTPDNAGSIRVLEKLAFQPSGTVADPVSGQQLRYFTLRLR